MAYAVSVPGFEGQRIEVQPSGLLSGAKLLVNGRPAQPGKKRGEFALLRDDGWPVTASWKQRGLGLDVPQLVLDGVTYPVVAPLPSYVWVWCALPIVLLFLGGGLGGALGAVAVTLNVKSFRLDIPGYARVGLTIGIGAAALVLYLIGALLLLGATGGLRH